MQSLHNEAVLGEEVFAKV